MIKTMPGLVAALAIWVPVIAAEQRVVVTVESHKDASPAQITSQDVMISVDNERAKPASWTPAASVGTELWVLIDDGTDTSVGLQIEDLRKFILEQASNTQIGVGYLRNGSVMVAQSVTSDHAAAVKALRLTVGTPGISSSPYVALADLIHKWPTSNHAREVLIVTSGIDALNGPGPVNPYLSSAIDAAQRAGVVVYSIYYGSAGHFGHSYWQINWGQNFLSQISEETGGEFYWQGNSNPVSFAPFLTQLSQRLKSQYVLSFQAGTGSHGFRKLKLNTEVPHAALVTQSKIHIDR